MQKDEVNRVMSQDPFLPLRLHLRGGKKLNVSFRGMTHVLGDGVLIFNGMKEGTRSAKSFDVFPFDDILRIEQIRRVRPARRRRKAS